MNKIKRANNIIKIIIILFALILSSINLINRNVQNSLKALVIIPVIFIPIILRNVFKIKFKYILEIIVIIFIFLSYYLGYVLDIYNKFIGYDKIVHTVFGLATSFFALFLLKNSKLYKEENKWFNILFCLCFTMGLAVFWEFAEFTSDKLFGKNDQGVVETGVDDTMYDLLVALLGSIIFCICYYFEVIFYKQLIIKKYLKYLN